ncbi:hypothetical protein FQN60_007986 [Etheostoma spectabile]|uniref:Uncharacterized protein n=1 Tax=Etheostoma spectabile TaxID=54343 RepID=A0A5J5CY00_9PERO|nr:hypothetical protein FQN60_007986 [Etheostoma spectabile]
MRTASPTGREAPPVLSGPGCPGSRRQNLGTALRLLDSHTTLHDSVFSLCRWVTISIAVNETWRGSIDVLFRVPVDVNPVDDPLQRGRFLSSLQLWQYHASGFQSASWGRLQEIGYGAHHKIAVDGLFNISVWLPPGETTPPPCRFTGPWSLPLTDPAAYNLPGALRRVETRAEDTDRATRWICFVFVATDPSICHRHPGQEQRHIAGTCSQESGRTVQGNPAEAALWR